MNSKRIFDAIRGLLLIFTKIIGKMSSLCEAYLWIGFLYGYEPGSKYKILSVD